MTAFTNNATSGDSGSLALSKGSAFYGAGGDISLVVGPGNTGDAGDLTAVAVTGADSVGGAIEIYIP